MAGCKTIDKIDWKNTWWTIQFIFLGPSSTQQVSRNRHLGALDLHCISSPGSIQRVTVEKTPSRVLADNKNVNIISNKHVINIYNITRIIPLFNWAKFGTLSTSGSFCTPMIIRLNQGATVCGHIGVRRRFHKVHRTRMPSGPASHTIRKVWLALALEKWYWNISLGENERRTHSLQ